MAVEEQHRSRSAGKGGDSDVQVMHDFIRKQAVNQQADYSVSKGRRGRHRFCLVLGEAEIFVTESFFQSLPLPMSL